MTREAITYDKNELRGILRAFKGMDEEALVQAKKISNDLATEAAVKIVAASNRFGAGANRVALGYRVAKSSKIGEIKFGFESQRFSGGGTTKELWPGFEFGAKKYKQFGPWSGPNPAGGRGSAGRFIFPTLREMHPYIIRRWEEAFSLILKEWGGR